MSTFIKQMVRSKLQQLTTDELLYHAQKYHFSINRKQATDITAYLQQASIDPFDPASRDKMVQELARITDDETADQAETLFQKIVAAYGLDDLFS
ncbi:hypothetical protein GCM10028778_09460 [Barrientosiimonas marina]|uniref:DUF2624 family protein n=1 Tax=Lentibacillus kimchii TaxID=1542911 RepID=A0ABW2UW28_9BACI